MNQFEFWEWMDMLGTLAFSSSEPIEDRVAYAEWWLALYYGATEERHLTT